MKLKKSESSAATIHEIFTADNTYRSPLFQRHYVWADKQLDLLWADIDSVLGAEPEISSRFLGAIVLKPLTENPPPFRPLEHWIIDGQQRLTTFYTLLVACAELARKLGDTNLAGDLADDYLLHNKSAAKNEVKLLPTIPDLRQFNEIMHCIHEFSPKVPGGTYGKDFGPLADVYLRHGEEIRKRIQVDGQPDVALLREFVTQLVMKIEFVVINLAAHHDANEVFNRLNYAGQPLQVIDLVRNEVFSLFDANAQEAESIYENKWAKFEQSLEVPGKKNAKLSEESTNGYFFPYALIRESSTTRSDVFTRLAKSWRKEIASFGKTDEKAVHIISSLSEFVGPYRAIFLGEKFHSFGGELWDIVSCFVRMPAPAAMYPYAMKLLKETSEGKVSEEDATACLKTIESFLVRRAFSGLEPTGLHAVFKNLWKKVGADYKKVVIGVQTRTVEFPDDEEFRGKIIYGNLYDRRLCNYVLYEYERSFARGDMHASMPAITADHIMPQSRENDWSKVFSDEDHETFKNTWANLVPLSNKGNAEKGTKNWVEAKALYDSESLFKSTRAVAKEFSDWSVDTIMARAEVLTRWALQRWTKPGEIETQDSLQLE